MEEGVCKKRAVLVDFNLLAGNPHEKDYNKQKPNYFLLKLCDNLEVSNYSDLIVLADDPQFAREWVDTWCLGENILVFRTKYDLYEDVQILKKTHKCIGAIVSSRFSYKGVNQRLVPIMKIVGK